MRVRFGQNLAAACSGQFLQQVNYLGRVSLQLFQTDAMDITTDVEVLERMLSKDGLSNSQGLTLGL